MFPEESPSFVVPGLSLQGTTIIVWILIVLYLQYAASQSNSDLSGRCKAVDSFPCIVLRVRCSVDVLPIGLYE